jgi:pimeloyl-ACP methyl ester carboxylesterase
MARPRGYSPTMGSDSSEMQRRLRPWRAAAVGAALVALVSATPSGADYADVNGIRMYYEVRGKGPVLVLLHGGAGSGLQFARQIPAFEMKYRLVIPDLCAQGRSTDREGPLSYHAMAEDVLTLLDRLGVHRFAVMGWSDGGNCGLDLAIHHRDRLKHLVTFGANASPDGVRAQDRAWLDTATVSALGNDMRAGWSALAPDPQHYEEAMTKILKMWKTEPHFTAKDLGSIKAKTLICAGENDVVRREHTEELRRSIPKAELWIVPGASHGAMQEKPEEVNAKVLQFLAR